MAKTISPVGLVVHFVLPHGPARGHHRPALVVSAGEKTANLAVLTDEGDELPPVFRSANVARSDKHEPGTYHLPEKG